MNDYVQLYILSCIFFTTWRHTCCLNDYFPLKKTCRSISSHHDQRNKSTYCLLSICAVFPGHLLVFPDQSVKRSQKRSTHLFLLLPVIFIFLTLHVNPRDGDGLRQIRSFLSFLLLLNINRFPISFCFCFTWLLSSFPVEHFSVETVYRSGFVCFSVQLTCCFFAKQLFNANALNAFHFSHISPVRDLLIVLLKIKGTIVRGFENWFRVQQVFSNFGL